MSATLQGLVREDLGSRYARRLRAGGRIPANLQGEDMDAVNLSIDEDEFLAARRHHEHVFELRLDRGDAETAMVKELQWDPFGERILHVEFRRVVLGRKTEAEVGLEFTGHPKGGILNHLVTYVTVLAFPAEIPDSLEVKCDDLEMGHPLLAKDIPLPEGVELVTDPDTQVAVVATARAEEERVAEAVEGEVPVEGAAEGEPRTAESED